MWSILVGLIERWWKDKPRLDLVRSVVRLRMAMGDCQDCYEAYLAAKGHMRENSSHDDLHQEWARALHRLAGQIRRLDKVLDIFDPAARDAIKSYLAEDSYEAAQYSLVQTSALLGKPTEFDIRRFELEGQFRQALVELDDFIQKNFKPEEIQAVHASKWR